MKATCIHSVHLIFPRVLRFVLIAQITCTLCAIFNLQEIRFIDNPEKNPLFPLNSDRDLSLQTTTYIILRIEWAKRYSALKSVSRFTTNDRLSAFSRQNITACGIERTWMKVVNKCPAKKREKRNKRVRLRDAAKRSHVDARIISYYFSREARE